MGGQSKRLQAWTGLGFGLWQSSSLKTLVWLLSREGWWVHATVRLIRPTPQVAEHELHSPVSHLPKWGIYHKTTEYRYCSTFTPCHKEPVIQSLKGVQSEGVHSKCLMFLIEPMRGLSGTPTYVQIHDSEIHESEYKWKCKEWFMRADPGYQTPNLPLNSLICEKSLRHPHFSVTSSNCY